jgi:hypothetical protein
VQILEIINLWMKVFTLLALVKEKKSLEMISLGVSAFDEFNLIALGEPFLGTLNLK